MADKISTRRIFNIALPLIFQQLSMQVQIWVDRAMLGHIDSRYFSAVGNSVVPFYAIYAIISGLCVGTTILIAQNIGERNFEKSKNYAECSFIGNSIFPLLAFLFFFFLSPYLFKIMGVQPPVLEYSISYIKILSFSLLLLGPISSCTSVMQGIGITKVIMISGILSNILNILLDWILIFGNLGFPKMNMQGAALASVISNYITAPIIIMYVFKSKLIPFKIRIKKIFSFRWGLYKSIFKIGVPSGAEIGLWHIGNIILVSFLNRLDIMAAGIYTLIFSIEILPWFFYMGFANAALTLVGQKTGENNNKLAINAGLRCLRFSLIICIVIAAIFISFPRGILAIFTSDVSLIDYAALFLIITSFTMIPRAINNVIGLAIKGIGDTRWMLYGQIFGTILIIVLSYVLIFPLSLGLLGLFIAFFVDESIRGIINLLRFFKGREFFFLKPFERN